MRVFTHAGGIKISFFAFLPVAKMSAKAGLAFFARKHGYAPAYMGAIFLKKLAVFLHISLEKHVLR